MNEQCHLAGGARGEMRGAISRLGGKAPAN